MPDAECQGLFCLLSVFTSKICDSTRLLQGQTHQNSNMRRHPYLKNYWQLIASRGERVYFLWWCGPWEVAHARLNSHRPVLMGYFKEQKGRGQEAGRSM